MENQSSHNLDQAIAAWRAEIVQQPGLSAEQIRELEIHVRDSYEGLAASGLTHEERFLIATRRLGLPNALEEEFQKLPSRLSSLPSATTRVLVWATAFGSFTVLALGELLSVRGRIYMSQMSQGSWTFSQTLFGLMYNPGWIFSLIGWATVGALGIWAYLRARRAVVRYAVIAFALFVPFFLSLPQLRLIGHFFGFLAQGPVWWMEMFTGTSVETNWGGGPIHSAASTAVFRAWWTMTWMLLACREVFLRVQDGMNFGFRSVKESICRALDAE